MASFHLTNKAVEDLKEIWNYTVDNWSENQADRYYLLLLDSYQDLADGKAVGKTCDGVFKGLLGYNIGKHIVFYRRMNSDRVEIARILHERMDLRHRIIEI
jgi:toxin ParE1/3/4